MKKMSNCTHGNGRALCFECFKAGMEKTRARQAAWTQRELPFAGEAAASRTLSEQEVSHRRRMLEHLVQATRRGA